MLLRLEHVRSSYKIRFCLRKFVLGLLTSETFQLRCSLTATTTTTTAHACYRFQHHHHYHDRDHDDYSR